MAIIFGRRTKQVQPLTRAFVVLILLAGWCCFSSFREEKDIPNSEGNRQLLSVDESVEHENEEIKSSEPNQTIHVESTNISCITPAIAQFPNPLLSKKARQHGGVIFHILLATYMFLGLAIVCDEFFVPSLTRFSDALGLSPDVAGATFMAAGSSAPELATSVIGVFVAQDDIGVSGVVGSAVFNITLVIAVCAIAAPRPFTLNWYSVCRDCFCYLICIIVLIIAIANGEVSWYESTFFLVLYVVYCIAMAFNSRFESWATRSLPIPESWRTASTTKAGEFEKWNEEKAAESKTNGNGQEMEMKMNPDGTTEIKLTPNEENKSLKKEEGEADLLKKPMALDDGKWAVFCWYVSFPLNLVSVYTIPDCRKRQYSRWFILSFFISVFWICLYSYVMVWMITIIGFTFGIPDTVMGLTFIAAGVSVPDALSGVAVVKEGHGDMAVSNAIGSNVFDILVCLGIPWFIKTVIMDPGSTVPVTHKGILYSTLTLFSTVIFLIVASHINSWRLDRKYGIILLIWYFIVMIFASLYETNVLGHFNPDECDSDI
ncbi:probable sodium/potassium/calcium exchanger CG1090 [Eurytemora carolleeae]|uniref:probable sodium/potassium/calcium exchanger CG1090 n=1 Tax=Eurytemora carolleeae TaxID=1294199 RepID=UPI000C76935E|nr:probable sodium/potassium/calcium exchanger CG1090 [Eurytemora carolleeae]|eukprot:XP_023330906.1 probable sodium/potassium/calcium exchanger CG1090 [Eurytemora affinis]